MPGILPEDFHGVRDGTTWRKATDYPNSQNELEVLNRKPFARVQLINAAGVAGSYGNNSVAVLVLDPATDFDGDGQSNGAEFTAGTHPLQGFVVLKITQINILGGDVNLTLSTVAGKNYQLETKLTLDSGPWANVGTPEGASGPSTAFTHPGGLIFIHFSAS